MQPFPYKKQRVHHDDGTWSDVVTVKVPAHLLRFQNIVLSDYQARMRDAAHLRFLKAMLRGEENPVIVTWACLEQDRPAADVFPDINNVTDDGECLLSANSLITYTLRTLLARGWLHFEGDTWQLTISQAEATWQQRADVILGWMHERNRLYVQCAPRHAATRADFTNFKAKLNGIAVGRVGFLRRAVQEQGYPIAFNTAYFLLEQDDFISHHSALGDPYNLAVHNGEIVRPPIYRRAVLWRNQDDRWHTDYIGMDDVRLVFPHDPDWHVSFSVNPTDAREVAVYTRHYGVDEQDRVIGFTPAAAERLEFTVIDRHIVSWKRGGGLEIPQNGFVLSFAAGSLSETQFEAICAQPVIRYAFTSSRYQHMREAIQGGPLLIRDGQRVIDRSAFQREQFWISRQIDGEQVIGLVPSDYPTDIDTTRAGRVGIGFTDDNEIVVVAVAGVNTGYTLNNTDSIGATLVELAGYLQDAGATEAINVDGGGSSQLYIAGGLAITPGDRRGLPGIVYERMIPAAGVIDAD